MLRPTTTPAGLSSIAAGGRHRRGRVVRGAWAVADPRRRYPSDPVVDEDSDAVLAFAVKTT